MSAPNTNITGYQGLWGKGSGSSVVLYVGQHSARIARFANSMWTTVYQDPSNVNVVSVWVSPNEEVFAVGDHYVDQCLSNCAVQTSWTQKLVVPVTFTGVCGSDLQHVYAVGTVSAVTGALYRFNPSTTSWDAVSSDTGSTDNAACWVAPNDDVYIAAQTKMLRYDGSIIFSETIEFPAGWTANDKAYQYWKAVGGGGTDVYATGTAKRVIWRDSPGHWSWVLDPASQQEFGAIAADPTGALAGGTSLSLEPVAARGARGSWALDPNVPDFSIWSAWAASENEYYLSGSESGGAIYQGTR
jgi:hypothetical protein